MAIHSLLRVGHINVLEYGYSMFRDALEELNSYYTDNITNMAFAARMANVSDEDFKSFLSERLPKDTKKKEKRKTTAEDHKRNMMIMRGH